MWAGAFRIADFTLARQPGLGWQQNQNVLYSGTSLGLKELLEKAASWPEEDREELVEAAAEIEARRTGRYTMTDAERRAVNQ